MAACDLSAMQLASLLRRGEISARQITTSVLERIEQREESLNAFITVTPEQALDQADRADARFRAGRPLSMLDGIPFVAKDNLCTRGIKTTCGSRILENYVPSYDATAVRRMLDQGAVLVGKTNMDEFAMGSSTENSAFGPTRNPHDPQRVPGGSSGGSAAAVAAGETVLALGSDTGGSIRLPAAFCGVVGLKPTYGRVSRYGLVSYASSLDQVGTLARTVMDCAWMLKAVCGHDHRDSTSADLPIPDFPSTLGNGIHGLRIGLPHDYFVEGLDPSVAARIREAADVLAECGARLVDTRLPNARHAISTYYLIATAEASSNLARYDGVRYGLRQAKPSGDMIQMIQATRSAGFGREVKRRIMLGSYVLSAGYYDAYYLKAQKVRRLIKADFDRVFEKVDCIVAPASPCLPFALGEKTAEPLQMYLVDVFTVSANLVGLPALSLNCGTLDGLPVGFQVMGRPFDEETVLRVGHVYEQAQVESTRE